MSKASEYAKRLAAADEARVEDIVIAVGLEFGATYSGEMWIKSSAANLISVADALRLRDWITENFGDENE